MMTIRDRFPEVHWVWKGAISFVYEVHPRIVVKVPKAGEFEREQFKKELKIYETFLQQPPYPSIVQCFFYADNGIFLEYMRGAKSCVCFAGVSTNCVTRRVPLDSDTKQSCPRSANRDSHKSGKAGEPLALRKQWMNDLAQAVTFLESLGLAHGDLRPENILLDRNRLKLSDFDCTAEIGTDFEACMAPYGRILSNSETAEGQRGTSGLLGPRTEQFALGSLYYLINYGVEVYGDQCITEDPEEHGPKVVELLQNMVYPKLNNDPSVDEIISKCWHNEYKTITDLASITKVLLSGSPNAKGIDATTVSISWWALVMRRTSRGFWCMVRHWWDIALYCIGKPTRVEIPNDDELNSHGCDVHQDNLTEDFVWKRDLCQNLHHRGLLQPLSSGEPERLGFSLEWYRHTGCGREK